MTHQTPGNTMGQPSAEQLEFLDSLIHIVDTRCHDGFNGHMVECRLGFHQASGTIVCVHKTGYFSVGCEADAESARWRIQNSPEYRNFQCSKFFKQSNVTVF